MPFHLCMAAFALAVELSGYPVDTIWPVKPKIFTVLPLKVASLISVGL